MFGSLNLLSSAFLFLQTRWSGWLDLWVGLNNWLILIKSLITSSVWNKVLLRFRVNSSPSERQQSSLLVLLIYNRNVQQCGVSKRDYSYYFIPGRSGSPLHCTWRTSVRLRCAASVWILTRSDAGQRAKARRASSLNCGSVSPPVPAAPSQPGWKVQPRNSAGRDPLLLLK